MPTELFLDVPLPYAICLVIFVILATIQLCLINSINETTKQKEKQSQELKEQNDLLVKNILEMLEFKKNADKQNIDMNNKNIELLEKLTNIIEERG